MLFEMCLPKFKKVCLEERCKMCNRVQPSALQSSSFCSQQKFSLEDYIQLSECYNTTTEKGENPDCKLLSLCIYVVKFI